MNNLITKEKCLKDLPRGQFLLCTGEGDKKFIGVWSGEEIAQYMFKKFDPIIDWEQIKLPSWGYFYQDEQGKEHDLFAIYMKQKEIGNL